MIELTSASADLLASLRRDAINDNGDDSGDLAMFEGDLTSEQRGNFTDLKVKGLIVFQCADSDGYRNYDWYKIDMVTEITTGRGFVQQDGQYFDREGA